MQQMNIVIGFLTAYFSNYFIGVYLDQWVSEPNIWRWMLAVELLPALLFVILLPKIPESSVWLMSRAGLANPLKSMELEHSLLEENRSVSSSLLRSVMHHKKNVSLLWSSRWRPIFLVAIFLGKSLDFPFLVVLGHKWYFLQYSSLFREDFQFSLP